VEGVEPDETVSLDGVDTGTDGGQEGAEDQSSLGDF
jgi:hypothetical protein